MWKIDRIGRSMINVVTTFRDLIDRGIVIRSLSNGIDPSTREGRLMLNHMATFAEYERELTQERVHAGVDVAGARGVKFGRSAPKAEKIARSLRAVKRLIDVE